jgi:hypothetical protein
VAVTPVATPSVHHRRSTCRGCGGRRLQRFLELGPTPLANAFLASPEEFAAEPAFPLDVYFCETCALVQLLDVIDPEVLFRDYIYLTGTSRTIAAHNRSYARTVVDLLGLQPGDLVVEVASNDGSLLRCFQPYGVRTLGIEPARNIAAMARDAGIETLDCFFGTATARAVRASHGPARAVLGNNVLAHVDDTQDFLRGAAELIGPDGLVITEVPYLRDFVDRLEYDTVYHEHLCYFSVSALMRLCEEVGLRIVRVDRLPIHGGSIRMYAGPVERHGDHAREVLALAVEEREAGLTTLPRYQRFARDVAANRDRLRDLLAALVAEGKSVAGYGAPAKGNTLLNYCGIGPDLLPYTVDKSPLKVGRYTPGMHLPVLPVETILARQPDYVLILAWNFAGEIMAQEAEYRARGGRFIIPIPEPTIV